jgi:hypothetical protein
MADPTTTSPTTTPTDLSPLAPSADQGPAAGAAPLAPSPEAAQLGLPDQLALGEILALPDTVFPAGAAPGDSLPAGEAAPAVRHAGHSRGPQIAGLIVTLAVLFFGGGFLWWRNRDSQYWPA